MPRTQNRLTAVQIRRTQRPGLYPDGAGLYLQVTRSTVTDEARKSWVLRFRSPIFGRVREMGLGDAGVVELARARIKADTARALLDKGFDPIEHRKVERQRRTTEALTALTFRQTAEKFLEAHKHTWSNAKHRQQWQNTLSSYVYPVFGETPVRDVNVDHVLGVIEHIWPKKTETASRVRSRIERVLDFARSRGWRDGDNPARWRGHLQNVLPVRRAVQRVQHHPALPYTEAPAFMSELKKRQGLGARALEFAILTAARTGETVNTRWSEIDLENRVWTVPASRMKAKRDHRVPLSNAAVAVLKPLQLDRNGEDWVFPGQADRMPLSTAALSMTLRLMKRTDITVHGFRSSFRDWTAEQTDLPGEVAEAALAHAVGDKVEAAYRRGDLFEKRRALMDAWAEYCSG